MSTQTTSTAVEPQALDTPTLGEMQLKYPLVLWQQQCLSISPILWITTSGLCYTVWHYFHYDDTQCEHWAERGSLYSYCLLEQVFGINTYETSDKQYTFVLYSRYQAIKRALIRGFSINSDIFFRKMIKSFATSVSIDILFCLIIHINILLHITLPTYLWQILGTHSHSHQQPVKLPSPNLQNHLLCGLLLLSIRALYQKDSNKCLLSTSMAMEATGRVVRIKIKRI